MQRSVLLALVCGLCALLSADAFAPAAVPLQLRAPLATSARPAACGMKMSVTSEVNTVFSSP
eukprot:3717418-Rhodomonas_salina.1